MIDVALPRPPQSWDALRRLRLAAWISAVLVVTNIVSGAAVRLSGSGLGCPDWPRCTRTQLTPPLAAKPLVEFGNRMVVVALTVSVLVTLAAALAAGRRANGCRLLAAGLLVGVFAEAVVGGILVYSKLNPYVDMLHFLVGMALEADAIVLVLRSSQPPGERRPPVEPLLRRGADGLMVWLVVVLAAGTATTGAGPHAGGPGAKRIPVPLDDMARVHSVVVILLVVGTLVLLWTAHRRGAPEQVERRGQILLGVMIAQGAIGYVQFFTHLPPLLVGLHVLGAASVLATMIWYRYGLSVGPPAARSGPASTPASSGAHSSAAMPLAVGSPLRAATTTAVPAEEET
jgi:cytochrome c oxidase assembly protein subunit 15